jgi:hypothetical protein
MSTPAHNRHRSMVRNLVLGLLVLSPALLVEAAPLKQANVTRIYNDVRVMEVPANVQKPATLNQVVRDQQAVLTGVQSRAELLFTDKTLTRIGANSIFTFKEGTRDMDLKRGTMLLQVPKGAGGAQIKTAAVTAAITGTTLLVEYQPGDGATAQTFAPTTGIADATSMVSPVADPAPASTGDGAVASEVEGNARILVPGESAFRPIREGESIPAGSSLMTSDSGSAVVSPAPGVVLRLLPNSVLRVNEATASGNTPKVRLDLKEGGVINIISKAKYQQVDYEVSTPQGVCAARGTVFGLFVFKGKVFVLGAHGASAFNGQSVGAGKAVSFGTGGGSIPPNSPEFRQFLNQVVTALRQASDRGLVPPAFLPQVRQQLERGGVKLDPSMRNQLQPPAPTNNPPGPQVAGSGGSGNSGNGNGKGFAKVVVLEGKVRVFITGKLGESMLIGPGQMIIFPPNTARLPEPVDIDLDLLVRTSKLVQEMDPNDGAQVADGGGTVTPLGGEEGLSMKMVDEAIGKQQEQMESGELGDTPFIILSGGEMVVLDEEAFKAVEALQDAIGGSGPTGPVFNPAINGPLTTISGLTSLDGTTTVSTNPSITQGVNVYDGRIMTGIPFLDQSPSKAAYLYGAKSPFDIQISFDVEAPVPTAAFRFATLNINEAFPIVANGPIAAPWLALVSENLLAVTMTATPLDLSPLAHGMILTTVDGDINYAAGTMNLANRDLILYARDGNTLADYDGSGGDIAFSNTATIIGGGSGHLLALAQNNLIFNGTGYGFGEVELSSGAGNLDFNGSLQGANVKLFNEGTVPGTQEIRLFGTGMIQATHVQIDGDTVLMNGSSIEGAASVDLWGGNVQLNSGTLKGPDIEFQAFQTLTWGNVSFQPLFMGGQSMVKLQGHDITLTQSQDYSALPDVKIDLFLTGGMFEGGGFDLAGIRNFSGNGTVSDLDSLMITGGNLNFNGNVQVNGDITALDGGVGAKGIINVMGDLEGNHISADGNIQAANITASSGVEAMGVTSSIITPGKLEVLGGASNVSANGFVEVGTLDAVSTNVSAPTLRINQSGASQASQIFTNTIQAQNADLTAGLIHVYSAAPTNGSIRANSLAVSGSIFYGGLSEGANGFNLTVETTQNMNLGPSAGEILQIDANGSLGTSLNGGNGGQLFLKGPSIHVNSGANVSACGGLYGGSTGRGGNGGLVQMEALGGGGVIQITSANVEAAGGGTMDLGAGNGTQQSGNGGTIDLRALTGNVTITNSSLLTETRESFGLPGPTSTEGGSILIQSDGPVTISDSHLLATGDDSGISATKRRGRIDIKALKNYATVTAAILINNSSELKAMSQAVSPGDYALLDLKTGDTSYTKGNNAIIQIGDATTTADLHADILRLQALNANGGIKIYAGSTLEARQQTLLYAGSLTTGGQIDFTGIGTINIDSPIFLARAGTINVGGSTTVQLSNANNVGLYADNRNWTGNTGAGGIQVNGANAVPNSITVNQNIGGANVNVNTRNAAGAPAPVGP